MANELRIGVSVNLIKGNTRYTPQFPQFAITVSEEGGPTPGQLNVPITGVDVSFTIVGTPGFCVMRNLDSTNYVEVGIHDGSIFHPLCELPPGGTPWPFYLSRNIGVEEDVPGTGTSAVVNTVFLRAVGGTCKVVVEAFKR